MKTLPNILTISRIFLIPVLILAFYANSEVSRWIAVIAFCCACATDFLDGYIARLLSHTTKLGQFLDPVADKLLVVTTLFLLAGFGRLSPLAYLPAIVILCREVLVSGLREFLGDIQISVPVSLLSKWKTALQMLALALLLAGDLPIAAGILREAGEFFLWVAAVLTLITGYDYLRVGLKHIA